MFETGDVDRKTGKQETETDLVTCVCFKLCGSGPLRTGFIRN